MSKTELALTRLPVRDHGFGRIDEIFSKGNTLFQWEGAQEWNGLTTADLVKLTVWIAAFIGITPDQAAKITVIFADHYRPSHRESPEGGICWVNNVCRGRYLDAVVLLNRSLEVTLGNITDNQSRKEEEMDSLRDYGLYDDTTPDDHDDFICHLTPVESIIWKLAEELKHAHVFLTAGSSQRLSDWDNRYLEILKRKSSQLGDIYDIDISEVAANRVVLRVLTYLATDQDRQAYFRACYLESLHSRRVYFPSSFDAAYIRTGYQDPMALKVKKALTRFWRKVIR